MKVLITGANRGLGSELAKLFLSKGHTVIAGMRKGSRKDKLDELKGSFGQLLKIVELDVTDESTIEKAASEVGKLYDSLDVIVNNAGVLVGREKSIEELDLNEVELTFDINTFGPVRVIKHFAPLLRNGVNQCVINISSEAGSITNSWDRDYAYSMSKAALNMFSQILSNYFKSSGIRVFAVHPGWIKTDMGGENAPTEPSVSAQGIYELINGTTRLDNKIVFVNYLGQSLPL